jgi:hypothetical protein
MLESPRMTSTESLPAYALAQTLPVGEHNLDHVAHFVPDIEAASTALTRLGFTLTPFSPQSHKPDPEGPLVPAGTGNRCVMLEQGYLEFLTPTHDTPIAAQLRASIDRYVGVHLVALGTAAPQIDYDRLQRNGFGPLPTLSLQRPIGTEAGEETARFSVLRVPPGVMAEGRIQFCQHHTPQWVWQERWISHANGVVALRAVIIVVPDLDEAADRYAKYIGMPAVVVGTTRRITTRRGDIILMDGPTAKQHLGIKPPAMPWIAGYVLLTRDMEAALKAARKARYKIVETPTHAVVTMPRVLGGRLIYQSENQSSVELR